MDDVSCSCQRSFVRRQRFLPEREQPSVGRAGQGQRDSQPWAVQTKALISAGVPALNQRLSGTSALEKHANTVIKDLG